MAEKEQSASTTRPSIVEADVIVIGGGGSGLAAAIEARSLGRRVVLIEKNEKLGGTTARSVGSITSSNTPHQIRKGIHDSPDDHLRDLARVSAPLGIPTNDALSRLLVDNVPETFRWLMSMGVEFYGPMPEMPHRKPRMHNVLPNSRAYIYHLEKRARRIGVEIMLQARARHLLVETGRVVGVACDTQTGPVELRARGGVVLATGDYSGNRAWRARHISEGFGNINPINPTNTGDGHEMVLEIGGRIINPQLHLSGIRFQAPPYRWITDLPPYQVVTRTMQWAMDTLPGWILRPFLMSFLTTILVPSYNLFKEGAVLVNEQGARFADEADDLSLHFAKRADQIGYILLDGRLVKHFSGWPHYVSTAPGIAYASVDDYRRSRKDVFKEAGTLADLGAKLGFPAGTLQRSVDEYNATVVEGTARRHRFSNSGPFVALGPVRYYINFTDGGMAVNERLQILGAEDKPIAGLFGAGFVGMGGVLLEGHGHHLGWAFTSGRLAGRHAAYGAVTSDLPEPGAPPAPPIPG